MIGLRELAILAVVVLVLYGRSGVLRSRQFQTIWPWISPQRRVSRLVGSARVAQAGRVQPTGAPVKVPGTKKRVALPFFLRGNRLFWFLTVLAATAVATAIFGRMIITNGSGPGLGH
jgi:hypothetical protein